MRLASVSLTLQRPASSMLSNSMLRYAILFTTSVFKQLIFLGSSNRSPRWKAIAWSYITSLTEASHYNAILSYSILCHDIDFILPYEHPGQ